MAGILSELRPVPGAVKKRKRVGRGPGSGHGKTSTKGHKGAKARRGGGLKMGKAGFEGGQMPLQRRLPKRGFTNIFKKEFQVVNLRDLAGFEAGSIVDAQALVEAGLVRSAKAPVKVLGDGEIRGALTLRVAAFSTQAKTKIEAAGGTAEKV